ncbi:MAG: D-tyrosyl-tRNA(Tyr) deacylase [Deltaproteobacteria bacterium]|nr:D-tyrosyl-tRNA(Tyr) deacylase [Deltaproteobacteria bacterium]MBT4087096.1 D-tyrosyl-tRNA(Tyr) deacylase [Deltaproteobacteria bacterium]MBT4264539.1 D-tyrosyl-tRNA(Tyr) deacylase [Deltaproteobacteria bacterium]MBT4638480.1 D-tyrosyl-tRNA(Tyr) deacylase [Deltaproteobacteria bacterium]MBT6500729.1 D-tyrosyl-tRNA(Tyr) deacylase [Deltaproteobacteria bacterium]
MKIVIQRVKKASVSVNQKDVGLINRGYLLLVGFDLGDQLKLLQPMLDKICHLKLFPDDHGRFAYSIEEIAGELLIVSQFTLSAELKKGKKPSFTKALDSDEAEDFFERFVALSRKTGLRIQTGIFGELMQVSLQNDGPVTILMDSKVLFPSLTSS